MTNPTYKVLILVLCFHRYVTNPSYKDFYALAQYCATKGVISDVQVMLLSNYAPTRLQRVRSNACYISATDGGHVCAPDLFAAAVLNPAKSIPMMTSKEVKETSVLYDLCVSGQVFDLYAESVEYFDAGNIVVAMRRATMADLGNMLMGMPVGGQTIYYFIKTSDIRSVQEGRPFAFTAFGDISTFNVSTQAVMFATCPALRTLPDVGGFVGHSLAASAQVLKTATGFISNPFAIFELLDARAAEACPENALAHSSLDDCGMRLLSLDDAFAEAYQASACLWGIMAWLVNVILPPSATADAANDASGRPTTAALLKAFLQGAAVTADATKIITLFDIPHTLTAFDIGAQTLLEGEQRRRRHLLGAASSVMGGISSGTKMGFQGFLRLTNVIGSVASGSMFAGADIGGMLATQSPPGRLAGAAVAAPSIAWAHFTYKALVPAVLDTVALVRAGRPSVAPLLLHIHASMDAFDALIHARQRQVSSFLLCVRRALLLHAPRRSVGPAGTRAAPPPTPHAAGDAADCGAPCRRKGTALAQTTAPSQRAETAGASPARCRWPCPCRTPRAQSTRAQAPCRPPECGRHWSCERADS